MDVRVKFFGGAKSVTGSKYLLQIGHKRVLVDCGLFQGLKELRLRNWDDPAFDPKEIDAVVLTHAHIDHSGYLPRLFKMGYRGPVFCTKATADLLDIMLTDAAKLQEEEAAYAKQKGYSKHADPKPLYDQNDVKTLLPYIQGIEFHEQLAISPDIDITFFVAGHILGAAIVEFIVHGTHQIKRMVFSGDLGRQNDPLMYAPEVRPSADVVFVESTYGNRSLPETWPIQEMASTINQTFSKEGIVMIPAFSVGRTQNILYFIKEMLSKGMIPDDTEVYVDSPMAIAATELYRRHLDAHKITEAYLQEDEAFIALRKNLIFVRSHEASVYLNQKKKGAIIISASGMMTGGRILHHLANRLPNPQDTLMIVGYQAVGTRGRRIVDGEKTIRLLGMDVPVRCQVLQIPGLSAHADQTELLHWLKHFRERPKWTFLIHGEPDALGDFKSKIEEELGWNPIIPDYLESFLLFENI
jgi:metallo-beta-lactamase family protein